MPFNSGLCPICASDNYKPLSLDLYRCTQCGVVYNIHHKSEHYERDYFVADYKDQYGRTYEEDVRAISAAAIRRIAGIRALIPKQRKLESLSLLDIGSALGFFLECAREAGFSQVLGIEISSYASHYCEEHYSIPVKNSPFPDPTLNKTFDIITAWYFIEHCDSPFEVLQKIYSMLNSGGVFAFSTPSIQGPFFQFHRSEWIASHPIDHRIDFSPGALQKILKSIGFRKIEIVPAGFHPERIVSECSFFHKPFELLYKPFTKLFAYSDTVEGYAVK